MHSDAGQRTEFQNELAPELTPETNAILGFVGTTDPGSLSQFSGVYLGGTLPRLWVNRALLGVLCVSLVEFPRCFRLSPFC
jgi:hypothetical protein